MAEVLRAQRPFWIHQLVEYLIGIILGAIGWSFLVQGTLTLLVSLLLFLFFDIKTRREEKYLRLKFPGYTDYTSRVKKLLPFIY